MQDPVEGAGLVLVVDGDDDEANLLEQRLRANGYEVERARDGEECLRKARSLGPTAVILSMNLPRLSGRRVLRFLKFDKKYKGIPVIALLTSNTPEDLEQIARLRADRYMVKPYIVDDLVLSLKNLVSESAISGFIDETLL